MALTYYRADDRVTIHCKGAGLGYRVTLEKGRSTSKPYVYTVDVGGSTLAAQVAAMKAQGWKLLGASDETAALAKSLGLPG